MTPNLRKFWLGALALIGAAMLAISATAFSSASRTSERNAPAAVARTARESVLYSFGGTDGKYPTAAAIQGRDGNFYGTTYYGGSNNDGSVFEFSGSTRIPTPTLKASPDRISFGKVDATGVSKARKVTVINASKSASAVIGTISMIGTNSPAAPFAIVAGSDHCSGQTLAPKKTCTFELSF